ncbi:hypothetical protein RF638_15480 [Kocuria sp. CPCC 205235]|uniref:hypothetical protein n=1 Tax=Kocuria sp. CPCC 205235 TaxID=3073549 RepID=UPI0034D6E3AD
MSKSKKKPGQPHSLARKREQQRASKREETKPEEEQIDMGLELRKAAAQMRRNKSQIEDGTTYASQKRRSREQSPGRTDGVSYG